MAAITAILGVYRTGLAIHGEIYQDETTGQLKLSLPERLPHMERDDTIIHICKGEETVLDLALLYYRKGFRNPIDLWPIIAQFQQTPIDDPTVPLDEQQIVEIPSVEYIIEIAYGEPLGEYPQL